MRLKRHAGLADGECNASTARFGTLLLSIEDMAEVEHDFELDPTDAFAGLESELPLSLMPFTTDFSSGYS